MDEGVGEEGDGIYLKDRARGGGGGAEVEEVEGAEGSEGGDVLNEGVLGDFLALSDLEVGSSAG